MYALFGDNELYLHTFFVENSLGITVHITWRSSIWLWRGKCHPVYACHGLPCAVFYENA